MLTCHAEGARSRFRRFCLHFIYSEQASVWLIKSFQLLSGPLGVSVGVGTTCSQHAKAGSLFCFVFFILFYHLFLKLGDITLPETILNLSQGYQEYHCKWALTKGSGSRRGTMGLLFSFLLLVSNTDHTTINPMTIATKRKLEKQLAKPKEDEALKAQ